MISTTTRSSSLALALALTLTLTGCAPRTIVQGGSNLYVLQAEFEDARRRLLAPEMPWSDAERTLVTSALTSLNAAREALSELTADAVLPYLAGESMIDAIAGDYGTIRAAYLSLEARTNAPPDPFFRRYAATARATYESAIARAETDGGLKAEAVLRYLRIVLRGYALIQTGAF